MATLQPPRSAAPPSPAAPAGDAPAPARACANCGTAAPLAYCPACGQEQHDYHRTLRALGGEVLDAFAGWDHKIIATFRTLLLRPGVLTREFLAGRRARYLRPLRLYLTASVAFFLAVRTPVPGGDSFFKVDKSPAMRARVDSLARARAVREKAAPSAARTTDSTSLKARLARRIRDRQRALDTLPAAEHARVMREGFYNQLGNALFALVPVFAVLLRVAYRRSGLFYAEHLVYALHVHAQALLALGAVHFAPGGFALLPLAWVLVYWFVAQRRVYGAGESRARTTVTFVGLMIAHALVILGVLTVALMLSLVSA